MPKSKQAAIPPAVERESGEHRFDPNDVPTPVAFESTRVWGDAAMKLSRKLNECARIKRRCADVLDPKGAEQAFAVSRELHQLSTIINSVPGISEETAAPIKRACIDRIVEIYRTSDVLLKL